MIVPGQLHRTTSKKQIVCHYAGVFSCSVCFIPSRTASTPSFRLLGFFGVTILPRGSDRECCSIGNFTTCTGVRPPVKIVILARFAVPFIIQFFIIRTHHCFTWIDKISTLVSSMRQKSSKVIDISSKFVAGIVFVPDTCCSHQSCIGVRFVRFPRKGGERLFRQHLRELPAFFVGSFAAFAYSRSTTIRGYVFSDTSGTVFTDVRSGGGTGITGPGTRVTRIFVARTHIL
mmetsp:Transcript_8799/g.18046  ORF Transcript_8799/g.18046 Transcript_8799/m.18046 type:complete len:231 (-) Transcript_8799:149-841(-)